MEIEQRIAVEKRIATAAVDDLLAAGFALSVDNGDWAIQNSTSRKAVLAEMFATDIETLYAVQNGKRIGGIFFVYGNDGWDVVNDYTTNLAPHLTRMEKAIAAAEPS